MKNIVTLFLCTLVLGTICDSYGTSNKANRRQFRRSWSNIDQQMRDMEKSRENMAFPYRFGEYFNDGSYVGISSFKGTSNSDTEQISTLLVPTEGEQFRPVTFADIQQGGDFVLRVLDQHLWRVSISPVEDMLSAIRCKISNDEFINTLVENEARGHLLDLVVDQTWQEVQKQFTAPRFGSNLPSTLWTKYSICRDQVHWESKWRNARLLTPTNGELRPTTHRDFSQHGHFVIEIEGQQAVLSIASSTGQFPLSYHPTDLKNHTVTINYDSSVWINGQTVHRHCAIAQVIRHLIANLPR